jgi:CubicO group peptidase (beta-lactamase class C family)
MMIKKNAFSLVALVASMLVTSSCRAQQGAVLPSVNVGQSSQAFKPISQLSCQSAIAYSNAIKGVSVLVLQNGATVCESYSGGGAVSTAQELWSGTKSFSGIMAAIAVKEGLLTLDEKVSDTIVSWKSDPQKSLITIRQLLSLTSGLVSDNPGRPGSYDDALLAPVSSAPGTAFAYGPVHYQAFGAVMRAKLQAKGMSADPAAYLRSRLLDPLGIDSSSWRRTPSGDILLPQGMALTARDWAKFGEFVRLGGRINGSQIVDPVAFADQFRGSAVHAGYGLTWWLPRASDQSDVTTMRNDLGRNAAQFPPDTVVAGGAGNQRLYVIPSRGLTIVRQASFDFRNALARRSAVASSREGDRWSDAAFVTALLAP